MDRSIDYRRETQETVVKASLTGFAVTALAVTMMFPDGFAGPSSASAASTFGSDADGHAAGADNPYAKLPAFSPPMSPEDLAGIRSRLDNASASLEMSRAATDANLERIRLIASSNAEVTFTPPQLHALNGGGAHRVVADSGASAHAPAAIQATPISYSPIGANDSGRDPHLELADLLLAHEQF